MEIKKIINAKTVSAVAGAVLARDLLLSKMGLQKKPSVAATVGNALLLVGVGAAIGASAALLLAPKAGNEIRGDLAARAGQLKGRFVKRNGALGSMSETPNVGITSDDVSIG